MSVTRTPDGPAAGSFGRFLRALPDPDPTETEEWIDSLDAVIAHHGPARAKYLLASLLDRAQSQAGLLPSTTVTPYVNTIAAADQPAYPGNVSLEKRIRAHLRWNAAAMVLRANKTHDGIGGHLASYASSAVLYEVGFNHFFRGGDTGPADHVYFQGHASPGVYARAFLEGRLAEEHLDRFRQEVGGRGLSSYPHPRLMPDFWEFPTVSMGLGPLNAIHHARFNRYLANRRLDQRRDSRVWCFLGDGECDEPETLAALGLAAREGLDNLVFVVNCNLQRLDGPVRGNDKIIQELEGVFSGAGWNVVKLVWGSAWDDLLARDVDGVLVGRMNDAVDGDYQKYVVESGGYIREHFFGTDDRLRTLVAGLSDDELRTLPRGGHDPVKVHAAYRAAVEQGGRPTVVLAKTVKGWALGDGVEGRNATHQVKKLAAAQLRTFRDRLGLGEELPDKILDAALNDTGAPPYLRPAPGSEIAEYLHDRRRALEGYLPARQPRGTGLALPDDKAYAEFAEGSERAVSTTMATTALLRNLLRDPKVGDRIVPIVSDEARTFGMDAFFREFGIYSAVGQRYDPVDAGMQLTYREAVDGQLLQEGITEAGATASFTAAGTAYATRGVPMAPFYVFYSMFGFQRVADLIWAASDQRCRGFLLGATAGRTTLNGEGLQHEDGHSHLFASAFPSVRAYDPAFAYEVAAIVRDGWKRMFHDGEDLIYYLTLYNENHPMPPMPDGITDQLLRGMYRWRPAPDGLTADATVLFSGPAWQAAHAAQTALAEHYGIGAELWSVTSWKALRDDALEVERWNRIHPAQPPRTPFLTEQLLEATGPCVAVTDYVTAVPDAIARWVPAAWTSLGTDGFGRSDTRPALRRFFEVDEGHTVTAVLSALAAAGRTSVATVSDAIHRYDIDTEAPFPLHV